MSKVRSPPHPLGHFVLELLKSLGGSHWNWKATNPKHFNLFLGRWPISLFFRHPLGHPVSPPSYPPSLSLSLGLCLSFSLSLSFVCCSPVLFFFCFFPFGLYGFTDWDILLVLCQTCDASIVIHWSRIFYLFIYCFYSCLSACLSSAVLRCFSVFDLF